MGWIIAIFILAPLSVYLINALFFTPQNRDIDEASKKYIENSIEISLKGPIHYFRINADGVNTGIRQNGNRSKLNSTMYSEHIFLDQGGTGKYFNLFFLGNPEMLYRMARDREIIAIVNKDDLENSNYGTQENPIPIFYFYIPHFRNRKSKQYLEAELTKETYKNTVAFYLAYIMPKDEFKQRFSLANDN